MHGFSVSKASKLCIPLLAVLVLSACSSDDDDPPPASIRGALNNPLESQQLPSAPLPSAALPSRTLPSVEVDETPSVATLRTLNITLEAEQEVGTEVVEGDTMLSATATMTVDETSGAITATVTAQNLSTDDEITMVHIHSGFAGSNGGILVGFDPTADPLVFELSTNVSDLADLSGNDLATFLAGGWYLNLHTTSNPAGHLRGQIFTDDVDVVRTELEGQQENPAVVNADGISGVGYVTFNVDSEAIVANVTVEGFVPFLDTPIGPVHLHSGFAGENGPVFLPLSPVGDSDTVFTGTEADATDTIDFANLAAGGAYINVHSEANPGGEVRGQIATSDINVVRSELQGQQENPAVVNAEGISGVGYATFDVTNETIVANVTVEGFVPFLDAPIGPVHLHSGFAGENGPVFLPLLSVDGSETVFRATEADATDTIDYQNLANGGAYFNVHSAANPGGEVRGQVVPANVEVSRSELEGQQENPAVANADGISGVGYVTVDSINETIVAHVTVEGFVPFLDTPIGPVHLHSGFAGENGPVFLPLSPVGDSETVFSGTEADATATIDFGSIAQGGAYINVHSAANPGGEVRGQVLLGDVLVVRSELQTEQEVPAVTTPAAEGVSGVGYLTLDSQDISVNPVANVTVTGFESTMVHVHRGGVAGVTGPIQIALTDISPSDAPGTVFRADDQPIASLTGLLDVGGYYFNAHSEANPAGEVRGQILVDNVHAFRAAMDGASVVPESNPTDATGVGYLTVNQTTEAFAANAQVVDFDPLPLFVSVNIGGDANNILTQLAEGEDGFFSGSGQVANLQGLLNGAYSIQANEEIPEGAP